MIVAHRRPATTSAWPWRSPGSFPPRATSPHRLRTAVLAQSCPGRAPGHSLGRYHRCPPAHRRRPAQDRPVPADRRPSTPTPRRRRPTRRATTHPEPGTGTGRTPRQLPRSPWSSPANASTSASPTPEQPLTIEADDTTFRIHDGDQLLTEVPRTTVKPIARFKVRKPEPSRQKTGGQVESEYAR